MMKGTMNNNNTTLKFLFVFLVAITCFAPQNIVVVEGKKYGTFCNDHKECQGDTITDYNFSVQCNGHYGCYEAQIAGRVVYCDGSYSCKDSTIMTTYVLKAWGPYGVASAEIYANEVILEGVNAAQYSKITNYDIREELKVYVAGGLAGLSSKIYCKGVGCYVECLGNACRGMKIYCDVGATCTRNCYDGIVEASCGKLLLHAKIP